MNNDNNNSSQIEHTNAGDKGEPMVTYQAASKEADWKRKFRMWTMTFFGWSSTADRLTRWCLPYDYEAELIKDPQSQGNQ